MNNPWDDLPHLDAAARPRWVPDPGIARTGQGLGQRLIEIHDHIREETRKLQASVADVLSGDGTVQTAQSALKALSLRQSYPGLGGFCSGYCELLTLHHTFEDHQAFPALAKAHPGLQPVLKQLFDEHELVAELIQRLEAMMAASAADGKAEEHLEHVAAALGELLLSHLAYEEEQLVAVLDSSRALPAGAAPSATSRPA